MRRWMNSATLAVPSGIFPPHFAVQWGLSRAEGPTLSLICSWARDQAGTHKPQGFTAALLSVAIPGLTVTKWR